MTCLFTPIDCFTSTLWAWFDAVPWLWVLGGIVLGALLGRYLGAIVVVAALFLLSRRTKSVPSSDIWRHPDEAPVKPRGRPTIFRGRK